MCNTNKIEDQHDPEFMQNYIKINNNIPQKKILNLCSGFKDTQKSMNCEGKF